jgi:hypothetical protein
MATATITESGLNTMVSALAERPMAAKKRGRPKKPGGEGTQVRIASDLAAKGRYLATERGVSLTDLLSELLRPGIEKEFRKAGKNLMEGE